MPSDTRNVKLGTCRVTFDGVDLGYTKGGVEVTVATETHQVMVDQFGNSPIDDVIMGRTVKAKVPLAETTLENLARIMPGATLIDVGGAAATGTITFSTAAPVDGDYLMINGVKFSFKTAPNAANPNELAIPASVNAAAAALRDAINASIDPKISRVTASASSAVVTLTADDEGTAGNTFPITKSFATTGNVTIVALSGGTDATEKKVVVPHGIGISLLQRAKKLVLHPQANDPTNRSEDFIIPLAQTPGAATFAYKFDSERVFNCEFSGYPDVNNLDPNGLPILFVVGDERAA